MSDPWINLGPVFYDRAEALSWCRGEGWDMFLTFNSSRVAIANGVLVELHESNAGMQSWFWARATRTA